MVDITEEEAEQYDRQIRLWGLESQKRLRGSNVLVIGLRGLGAEVTKNIILAGVKSITLMDSKKLTFFDKKSQFLAAYEAIGQNRATASQEKAQILNPMVDVKVDEGNIKSKNDEFFASFDVILATDCNLHSLLYLNSLCRKYSIKFFCADVFGSYGYIFTDLQNHVYAEEQKIKNKQEKLTVKKTIIYESLKSSLGIDWSTEKSVKKLKKMDSTYFLIRILLNFRNKVRRNPSPLHEIEDMQLLQQLRQKTLKSLKVENIIHIEDKDLQMVFSQLSPICAIIGGVLAQEVIKALSQHGEPYKNLFLFNPNNLVGQVINLEKN